MIKKFAPFQLHIIPVSEVAGSIIKKHPYLHSGRIRRMTGIALRRKGFDMKLMIRKPCFKQIFMGLVYRIHNEVLEILRFERTDNIFASG